MGLLARNPFCDKVRLAVTLTGMLSGAAAQKHGEELLAEVAHNPHSFPADLSGGPKQRVLSSGERILRREAGRILWEERDVLTAGAAVRTRLRAQRNRARFRGCRRAGRDNVVS